MKWIFDQIFLTILNFEQKSLSKDVFTWRLLLLLFFTTLSFMFGVYFCFKNDYVLLFKENTEKMKGLQLGLYKTKFLFISFSLLWQKSSISSIIFASFTFHQIFLFLFSLCFLHKNFFNAKDERWKMSEIKGNLKIDKLLSFIFFLFLQILQKKM